MKYITVYATNASLLGYAYILALPVVEKPKNFFDICFRENLNIRFCLAFSQSWLSNHKMYFGFYLLHIPVGSDTTSPRSVISLSKANFLGVYDFGFGWLERSAALFSVLILMTIMIQED